MLKCKYCNYKSEKKDNLFKHLFTHDTNNYKCNQINKNNQICDYNTTNLMALKKHFYISHNKLFEEIKKLYPNIYNKYKEDVDNQIDNQINNIVDALDIFEIDNSDNSDNSDKNKKINITISINMNIKYQ